MKKTRENQDKELPEGVTGERLVRKDVINQMAGYLLLVLMLTSLVNICGFPFFSDLKNEDKDSEWRFFKLALILALSSMHVTMSCMFAHLLKRKYLPLFGNRLACFVIFAITVIHLIFFYHNWIGMDKQVISKFLEVSIDMLVWTVIFGLLHFIICIMNEMANALNIRVFFVKKDLLVE